MNEEMNEKIINTLTGKSDVLFKHLIATMRCSQAYIKIFIQTLEGTGDEDFAPLIDTLKDTLSKNDDRISELMLIEQVHSIEINNISTGKVSS